MKSCWSAPSNIALVKYWGKKEGLQLPANPSVSFTLSRCYTKTKVSLKPKSAKETITPVKVFLAGQEKPEFLPKIEKFFSHIKDDFSFINDYHVVIESMNTFPHSSGIASSASSMAALSLCLLEIKEKMTGEKSNDFFKEASFYARIGSGSACRSLYPGAASWGGESDVNGTKVALHENLQNIQNKILVIESGVKQVSSTVGHSLMNGHPFQNVRYDQAVRHYQTTLELLKKGDWESLGQLIEQEALSLHAMMMTSDPSFLLMESGTVSAIKCIRRYREESEVPLFFTLDAGANIHLLYPLKYKREVDVFFQSHLAQYCQNGRAIDDFIGQGPVKFNEDEIIS